MNVLPTALSAPQQVLVDQALVACRKRIFQDVKEIVGSLHEGRMQQLLYELAFRPSAALPKRSSRPTLVPVHLAEQVLVALEGSFEQRGRLRRFVLVLQEYADLMDDLVDGDVAEGRELEVTLAAQLLLPVLVREVSAMGQGAVAYWSERFERLVASVALEKRGPKCWESYARSLERQCELYALGTGLAAVLGQPADEQTRARAEAIGRHAYRYSQLLLDLEQAGSDTGSNWNALDFLELDQVLELMAQDAQALRQLSRELPAPCGLLVYGLFSVDLAALRQRLRGDAQAPLRKSDISG